MSAPVSATHAFSRLDPRRGAPAALFCVAATGLLVAAALELTGVVGRDALAVLLGAVGLVAVLVCVAKAIQSPGERTIWLTLGAGKLGWAIAVPGYLANEGAAREFPTIADAALIFYPAMAVGFALLARRRLTGLPRALWLDAGIAGLALAAVATVVIYEPMFDGSHTTDPETVALIYSLADAALAGFMVVALLFAGWRSAPPLVALAGGAVVTAFGDTSFAQGLEHGNLTAGALDAVLWTTGVVLVSAAAPLDVGKGKQVKAPAWALVGIPVAASLVSLGILVVSSYDEPTISVILASVLGLLAITRFAVSLIDNQHASERRRREDEERHRREEAERASRAKTEFLGRMSHEVRTPLNSILGFAQLLVDDLSGADRASVERILRAGNHLQRLIDDILDLSTIEAGQTVMTIQPTDLGPTIEESIALLEPLARDRGTRVVRGDAPDAPGAVLADPKRLKQVLLNLISNAIKYGGSDVAVRVEGRDGSAVIKVIDKGPGIPDEHLAELFTPFERGSARGSGIEGSGLGLALAKNLVDAMAGSIDVATGPGGSTFSVTLPAAEATQAGVAPRERGDGEVAAEGDRRRRVLYIEDHASNIALVERLLERRPGFELLTATTGRDGLDLAADARADVILLDLDLPDMDGEEVLERLRADPATADTPVVVVSADATAWRQERLARAGAAAYVVKPIQLASFMATLEDVLRAASGRSAR